MINMIYIIMLIIKHRLGRSRTFEEIYHITRRESVRLFACNVTNLFKWCMAKLQTLANYTNNWITQTQCSLK